MSRYLGSTWKISRRLGFSVEETGREIAKRNFAPGQHGAGRKRKISEYGKQLREKQKVRFMYGVNERQLRRIFGLAVKNKKIVTGYGLLILLESRVDNLCYRLGFARTRNGARQLVNHGHILVNGKKVDIPSYICNPGDVITLTESAKGFKSVTESLSLIHGKCPYAEFDSAKFEGKFVRVPERAELNQEITESLIVEFYNHLI